jgi:hypothetical protein
MRATLVLVLWLLSSVIAQGTQIRSCKASKVRMQTVQIIVTIEETALMENVFVILDITNKKDNQTIVVLVSIETVKIFEVMQLQE